MNRLIAIALSFVLASVCGLHADTLTPIAGPAVDGSFVSFSKGSFELVSADGRSIRKLVAATRSLTLDAPREVRWYPRSGPDESIELLGFDKGQFTLRKEGKTLSRPLSVVTRIEVPFSVQTPKPDIDAEAPEPGQLAVAGKPTVVHFHLPSSIASVRQASLIERLVRDRRGSVAFRRITIESWSSPAVQRYGLKSLPQFWFYDASGTLKTETTERFTDDDLTRAFGTMFP